MINQFRWVLYNAKHVARFGHHPEWVGSGGLVACIKCVKRGRPARPLRKLHALRMEW